VPGILSPQGP
jgi:hypothetical protein